MLKAAFVPDEMRVQLVDELLKQMTVRGLSRAIRVDPRAVIKYRNRQSYPSDEVFARILSFARSGFGDLYESFTATLESEFKKSEVPLVEEFLEEPKMGRPRVTEPLPEGPKVISPEKPELPKPEVPAEARGSQIQPPPPRMHVHEVMNKVGPETMALRKAYGSLLSLAAKLRNFTPAQLITEFNCPTQVASGFCERLVSQGLASREGEEYVLKIEVVP